MITYFKGSLRDFLPTGRQLAIATALVLALACAYGPISYVIVQEVGR